MSTPVSPPTPSTGAPPAAPPVSPPAWASGSPGLAAVATFFAHRGWAPFDYQLRTCEAYRAGRSGIVNVPTGAGKTWSAWLGPLSMLVDQHLAGLPLDGLRVLYLSPLRAVVRDIDLALREPVDYLGLPISIETRTGDTSDAARVRQKKVPPNVLLTTPESLALMLSWDDAPQRFAQVECVILDEWHEMLGTKRGALIELLLTRLRAHSPTLATWALTATIANLDEAAQSAVGMHEEPVRIQSNVPRPVVVDALLPERVDQMPLAGHLGLQMATLLVGAIDPAVSTLVFTNTRSQAERWFAALANLQPDWLEHMALHHGSLDRADREAVERGLKNGDLRLVVCTSSLDLGVDFAAVDRVFQVGSPRGVARLVQRAGRSAHRPGATCRITCVPTHALEVVEIAALRRAVDRGQVEPRELLAHPLDVLAQHLVTCGLGGGFTPEGLLAEVRGAYAYRNLSVQAFSWTLDLVAEGGETLRAYPQFRRLESVRGLLRVVDPHIAQLHRMNVGVITSQAAVRLTWANGTGIGSVEETFIDRLRPDERFLFAGRVLRVVKVDGDRAIVEAAKGKPTAVPRWGGWRLPISQVLSTALRETLQSAAAWIADTPLLAVLAPDGDTDPSPDTTDLGGGAPSAAPATSAVRVPTDPELAWVRPVLELQLARSVLPGQNELLVEVCETSEGFHAFLFPFEGLLVHEGLGPLLALRLSRLQPATFRVATNDYGIELLCDDPFPWARLLGPALCDGEQLEADILASVDATQLTRRRFREVARVAMLTPQNHPGRRKGARQMLASASLLYQVFEQHDPNNLLLHQARREVLEQTFEQTRLVAAMTRMASARWLFRDVGQPTPLGFPLVGEREAARVTSESIETRLARMQQAWGLS